VPFVPDQAHFEHGRCRVTTGILTHLSKSRRARISGVRGFRLFFKRLMILPGNGGRCRFPTVARDLGFVTHTTREMRNEIPRHAPWGLATDLPSAMLVYPPRRANKAHDGLSAARSLLDRQGIDNAFFNLFKARSGSSSSTFCAFPRSSCARFTPITRIDKIQSKVVCAHTVASAGQGEQYS